MRSIFLFSLLHFFGSTLFAQSPVRCEALFATKMWQIPEYESYGADPKVNFDPKVLQKKGFEIENGELWDLRATDKALQILGRVKIIRPQYLFEWASASESKNWIEAGGIDYMPEILQQPGQASGKGYYVSVDPFDSSFYGTTLTSFKTAGPLRVLEYEAGPLSAEMFINTELVQRLRDAGIDALRLHGFTLTWISVISEGPLKHAGPFPKELMPLFLNDDYMKRPEFDQFLGTLGKIPRASFRGAPKDSIYRRFILLENLSAEEIRFVRAHRTATAMPNFQDVLLKHVRKMLLKMTADEQKIFKTENGDLISELDGSTLFSQSAL